ncbi:MAG: hypothetical protein A2W25_15860 [candidate division Zixibacteria bacterium RBG_16_53_22]|nr:MAG: hypothetical protein A2W25_15860 [candidate division Zixibacteria bacterium RBG_16_53_22]
MEPSFYNGRMKYLITALMFLILAPIGNSQTVAPAPFQALDSLQRAIDMSLSSLKMHRGDLTFRGDYLEEDPYRLPIVDTYMKEPLKIIDFADSVLTFERLTEFKIRSLLGNKSSEVKRAPNSKSAERDSRLFERADTLLGRDVSSLLKGLLYLARGVDPDNWPGFSGYSRFQRDSLVEGFTLLLEENVEDEFKTIYQLDSIAQYEDRWAERLVKLTENSRGRGKIVDEFISLLDSSLARPPMVPAKARNYSLITDYGDIVIGDTSANTYQGDFFIIIDPGGDDTYNLKFTGVGHQIYIIDLSGHDSYSFPKGRISPLFFGGSMIVDFKGDDCYTGGSYSLGAGLFGVSVLWDKAGNDRYYGDAFTQGAGCFGVGILRDDSGNDSYQAALFAQGFGFVDGVGILWDFAGNDTYIAGGRYKDILRYKDHYLSLSQGFAYGIRPKMSGGIGLLVDKAGNDAYISDIFGQGSSYWYGLGVLSDSAGNDQYVSFQYAQGAATHMTVGILFEAAGDDVYSAKGVSQGCGHDRAAGLLVDLDGNDSYNAYDLSQAAGSANGLGFLADIRGVDAYVVRSDQNTRGFGQPRRDYGSIGIFIDLSGRDGYAGGVGHDSTWWSDSKWGVGIDQ